MSRMRLVTGALALAAFTGSSAWAIASTLPLRTEVRYRPSAAATTHIPAEPLNATGQQPARTTPPPPPPPQPPPPPPPPADGRTNPRVLTETKPAYPAEALQYSPGAMVWVKASIGANGEVTEAKAARWRLTIENSIEDPNYWASKPERAFIDAAEAAALKWKFAPPDANTRVAIELLFTFRNVRTPAPGDVAVVRVGGDIKPPTKIRDVRPVYPAAARAANVQGVVILETRVGIDGSVVDATVVRSIPMLDDAAVDAVRQWRYTPTSVNGDPVEVVMTVTINFATQ